MSSDRRDFFKRVAGATATLAGLEAVRGAAGTTPHAEAAGREPAAGRFALELEGALSGFVQSADGGHATADVVEEAGNDPCSPHKHLANVKYGDITVECGTGMNAAFYEWLQSLTSCDFRRKSGAILSADFRSKEVARLDFTNALITEFGMPALDAGAKDPALMKVTLSPESTRREKGSGNLLIPCGTVKQKKWLPSNFRLTLGGLDCTKVTTIDALTIKQTAEDREPGKIEFPNLVLTVPESAAESFFEWHEDFVINGNNTSESEKSGTLEYLPPNQGPALFTIGFQGLGIFKLAPEKVEAGSEQIRRVRADMYCEQMTFKLGTGAVNC